MIHSMTGLGFCEKGNIYCEIKTLNHRFFTLSLDIPENLVLYEYAIKSKLKEAFKRGAVTLKISVEGKNSDEPFVDIDCAKKWYNKLQSLRKEIGIKNDISIETLISFKGVLSREKELLPPWNSIESTIDTAIEEVIKMRKKEGRKIEKDIKTRLTKIERTLNKIKKRELLHTKQTKEKLIENATLLESENSTAKKIEDALLTLRTDINEECTRLGIHLQSFRDILNSDTTCGKKLTFLTQEMVREINTLSSKVQDAEVSLLVIDIKDEIENIREQLENIL